MALGTIYVEMDLSLDKYEKNQAKVLASARSTALSIEKNWQTLGATSDNIFQAMANGAINAYTMIANSAKASFAEQVRAKEAMVAKLNALNSQLVSSQAYGGIGIRSSAAIAEEMKQTFAWYAMAKQQAQGNANELIRIEAAKNAKIISLENELGAVRIANEAKANALAKANAEAKIASTKMSADAQRAIEEKLALDHIKWAAMEREAYAMNDAHKLASTKATAAAQTAAVNEHYNTLGIRSQAAIMEQKQGILNAATAQQAIVAKGSQDWINIERAKNEKLKELNAEMVGQHEMSMASLTRAILRWYAAIYVAQAAFQSLSVPFIKGFKAVEEYNTAVASMAAMVVTFGDNMRGLSLDGQWKNALAYSTAIIPVLEEIAAKTLLSGQETIALANAFARSGVFLDASNAKQIEAFTRISNALPLMTQGQEITRQINTEIRSLMTGMNEQSSMMLITLKSIDPQIEKHLAQWRATDTVLENIGRLLKGFGPATEILEKQWKAVYTSLDTTVTQILRGAMKQSYEDIIALTQELDKWLQANRKSISDQIEELRALARALKGIYDAAPSGTFEAASMGIIGKILWGNQVGLFIAAISLVNTKLKETNMHLGSIPKKTIDAWEAIKNIFKSQGPRVYTVPDIGALPPLTKQEKANSSVIKIMKMMDETILKNHKESIAEYDKATNLQTVAFKDAGATEEFINKYLEKRIVLKEQQFSLDKKAEKSAEELAKLLEKMRETMEGFALSGLDGSRKEFEQNRLEAEKLRKEFEKLPAAQKEIMYAEIAASQARKDALVVNNMVQKSREENAKSMKVEADAAEHYRKIMAGEYDFAATENERAINKIIKDADEKERTLTALAEKGKVAQEQLAADIVQIHTNKNKAIIEREQEGLKKLYDLQLNYLKDMGQEYTKEYRDIAILKIKNEADILEKEFQNAAGGPTQAQQEQLKAEQDLTLKLLTEWEERLKAYAAYLSGMGDTKGAANATKAAEETAKKKIELQDRVAKNAVKNLETGFNKEAYIAKKTQDLDAATLQGKLALASEGFGALSTAFSGISQMYAEGSANAEAWKKASEVMLIAQKAVAVVQAVVAVATQGSGDPYTAFARIAAMVGAMAALLSQIGVGFSGGGAATATEPPKMTATGMRSTVLGAEYDTESESIKNSLEMLDNILGDTYDLEYRELRGIHSSMKQLNDNITGLVRSLVAGGGQFDAGIFGNISTKVYGAAESFWQSYDERAQRGFWGDTPLGDLFHGISNLDVVGTWVNNFIGETLGSIFGGKVTGNTSGAGLTYGAPTVGGSQAGQNVNAQWYQTVAYKKEGGWFGSDSYWSETQYQAVDESVTRLLTKVYKNLSDTLVTLTTGLGQDMSKTLAYSFGSATFDLRGMTGEQVDKTLKAYFSQVGDIAVNALFGGLLRQYQKVGEGLFETAVRVLMDKEVIVETLRMTGQSFTGTIPQIIAFSEAIIEMAGGLDKITEAASMYYDAFYSDAEKMIRSREQMVEAFTDMNLAMPQSREAYRDLVEGLDLMTESGKEAYVAMLMMAEGADKYYDMLDEIMEKLRSARESMRLEGMAYSQKMATAAQLSLMTVLEQARQGNFANIGSLDSSLSELTSSASSSNLFATRQEYEANFYRTYNRLAELEGIVGGTIPIQEQQLIVLQQIAENTGQAAPGFASGGSFGGGWRVVGENGPELEYTGASRIFSNKDSKSLMDNSELVNEVKQLRQELYAATYQIAKNTAKTSKITDRWDVDGLPSTRT